jgi:hypothetical protein
MPCTRSTWCSQPGFFFLEQSKNIFFFVEKTRNTCESVAGGVAVPWPVLVFPIRRVHDGRSLDRFAPQIGLLHELLRKSRFSSHPSSIRQQQAVDLIRHLLRQRLLAALDDYASGSTPTSLNAFIKLSLRNAYGSAQKAA